jgi:hypothetical protein
MQTTDAVLGDVEAPKVEVEPACKMDLPLLLDRTANPDVAELSDHKGDTLTTEEVIAVRDMMAAERDAVVLRGAGGAPGLEAVRRVIGTASSVPCNWHQATIFFMGSENPADATMNGRARLMLFAGLLLIVFQVLTAVGIFVGVVTPSCKTSKQCGQVGMFCVPEGRGCQYCGLHGPLLPLADPNAISNHGPYNPNEPARVLDCPWAAEETLGGRVENYPDKCLPPGNKTLLHALCTQSANWKELLAEGGYSNDKHPWTGTAISPAFIKSWCESCVTTVDWEADMFTTIDLIFDSVDAMGPLDWTALVFASYIVGQTIVGELKDMLLCQIAIERLGDKLGPWRHPIIIGIFMRRTLFLPVMLGTVAMLVVFRGGDSLSVCFNTVAILFMAEADNMAYHFGLAEPQKARMETDGRVALTTEDSQRLQETKMVYLPVIIVGISVAVKARDMGPAFMGGFIMMNMAEAIRVLLFEETKQKPKGVAMALLRFVVGVIVFTCLFFGGTFDFGGDLLEAGSDPA